MKTALNLALIILFFIPGAIFAQDEKKVEEITIKTSAVCGGCEDRIVKSVKFEKGVKKTDFDVKTGEITIAYRTDKTSPEKLRIAISKAGYDADDVKADEKAFGKLPGCCQRPDKH